MTDPVSIRIPGEFDLADWYDLNFMCASLVSHMILMTTLITLRDGGRWLKLLKEEAVSPLNLGCITSVPCDEFLQLCDLQAIHLLLSIKLKILRRF